MGEISWRASAVLVWLPLGETPSVEDFDERKAESPPNNNPEAYWHFGEAAKFADSKRGDYGADFKKAPWIKCGEEVVSPERITAAAKDIPDDWRGGGAFND